MAMTILRQLRRRLDARRFRYRLAIGAIFKDEARYLDEWLAFHERVGVDHFYLYDNGSADGFRQILAPWVAAGKVTLIDWPGTARQLAAYNDCLRRARADARWLGFIDIDEFLFSPRGAKLPDVLVDYDDLPAVFVYWSLYGSSGHEARPAGPVIEAYTRRLDEDGSDRLFPTGTTGHPRQGKSIVNPRRIRQMGVHAPIVPRKGTLDEARRPPPRDPTDHATTIVCNRLRINHYWSRSLEDVHDKAARGRASVDKQRDLAAMLAWERALNAVEDRVILTLPHTLGDGERARQPLTLDRYDQLVLSPAKPLTGSAFRVGAHTRGGAALTEFCFARGDEIVSPPRFHRPRETVAGRHLYGGTLARQFGHFLLESLARSWALAAHPDAPVAWQCESDFAGLADWQVEIFALLGIDPRRFHFVTRPTAFADLLLPAPGYRIQTYSHPDHMRHMARHPFRTPVRGKKVWLSRSHLPEHLGGRVIEEAALEEELARRSWDMVVPESLSVAAQLRTIDDAEHIAGFIGSAFHILILGRDMRARVTLVQRWKGKQNRNYDTIAEAKGIDQRFLATNILQVAKDGPSAMSGTYRFATPAEASRIADLLDSGEPLPPYQPPP